MTKKVNIGIVGCGRVFLHYEKILKKINPRLFRIVGLCDTNKNALLNAKKKINTNIYYNVNDLIKFEKLDLVFILTPSGNHYYSAKKLLKNKINVLVEKPISMTPHQGKEIISIAKKNKCILHVAFQNRYNKAVSFAHNLIKNNKLGKILTVSTRLIWCRLQDYYEDEWHGTWLNDGGVINQQAIHHLDATTYLVGGVKSLVSYGSNLSNKLQAEDTMTCLLVFSSGALGTIQATTSARPIDFEASILINGEKGFLEIGGIALNKIKEVSIYNRQNKLIKYDKSKFSEKVENGYGNSHKILIEDLIKNVRNKTFDIKIDPKSALETTKLIHGIYNSHENKKWIEMKNKPLSKRLGK